MNKIILITILLLSSSCLLKQRRVTEEKNIDMKYTCFSDNTEELLASVRIGDNMLLDKALNELFKTVHPTVKQSEDYYRAIFHFRKYDNVNRELCYDYVISVDYNGNVTYLTYIYTGEQ